MRKFRNAEIECTCPKCGYSFTVDTGDTNDSEELYKTDPATTRTDGDDEDNTGAETNNMLTNKTTPEDSLANLLVAAAQKNSPKAKAERPVAKPANEQSAAQMLAQALAEAREKLIGRK